MITWTEPIDCIKDDGSSYFKIFIEGILKTILIFCRTGDVYAAARDYLYAIQLWSDTDAYFGLVNCLIDLKWKEEAQKWLNTFEKCKPDVDKTVIESLKEQVNHCETPDESEESEIITDDEKYLRKDSFDYELRYIGHCNTTTDIKEANFLGNYNLLIIVKWVLIFCFAW